MLPVLLLIHKSCGGMVGIQPTHCSTWTLSYLKHIVDVEPNAGQAYCDSMLLIFCVAALNLRFS